MNMRTKISMFLDGPDDDDHESHASKFQKAHILAYRINFILKGGLNMSEGHTGKPATKIFGHI